MRFIWDERKRRTNLARHGLDFREAADRFQGIGFIHNRMVVIIYTEPEEDLIRGISLRKATKHERERFTQDLANRLGPR